jgi:hypothetical protein
MISDEIKRYLCLATDKIWALDVKLHKEFNVPKKVYTRWTRSHPYPTTTVDALDVMRTLKNEFDEKAILYEVLTIHGVEETIAILASEMNIPVAAE